MLLLPIVVGEATAGAVMGSGVAWFTLCVCRLASHLGFGTLGGDAPGSAIVGIYPVADRLLLPIECIVPEVMMIDR